MPASRRLFPHFIDSITLAIANYNGTETLGLSSIPPGISVFWNEAQGILSLTASDGSTANSAFQTALNNVVYQDGSNDAPTISRTITVTASNSFDDDVTATETIGITRVNDFPNVDIAKTDYNTTEQTPLSLKGTGIAFSDADVGSRLISVEVSVSEGAIFVVLGNSGVQSLSNDGASTVFLLGTLSSINALFAAGGTSTVNYKNFSDAPSANVTLSIIIRDNGNTGDTGAPSIPDVDTATIHITPVNDVSVALANTKASVDENTSTATPIKVADIVVTDPDGGTNTLGLVGADAGLFEIVGTELFLKAGTVLDFETKESYSVAVTADDDSIAGTPDTTTNLYTLSVNNLSPETKTGTDANDNLVGGSDVDLIFGLGGIDDLVGAGGNDTLTGGLGLDELTGGLGRDTFKFNKKGEAPKGVNHDLIKDFSGYGLEGDLIDLHVIDANTHRHGNQKFKFIGEKAFHHKAGELHVVDHGSYVTVEGDVNGNGKADFQIDVHNTAENLSSLLKGDFVL